MMRSSFSREFFPDRSESSSPGAAWGEFVSAVSKLGFKEISYQLTPERAGDRLTPHVWSNLSGHSWVRKCNEAAVYLKSPIVRNARLSGKPVYWANVRTQKLDAVSAKALRERDESGISRFGVTIPVFGPFRRNGFVGLDLATERDRLNDGSLRELRTMSQVLHSHVCDAAPEYQIMTPSLSKREREVLRLMADGLSNPEIADRLNIAKATADTFVRRAYEKLGVGDRVSAVLSFLDQEP